MCFFGVHHVLANHWLGVFGSCVYLWFLLLLLLGGVWLLGISLISATAEVKCYESKSSANRIADCWKKYMRERVSEWVSTCSKMTGWQSGKNHNGMRDKKNQQQHIKTIECRSQSRRTNSKINLESLSWSCNWIWLNLQTQKAWIKVSETIWKWNITFL
jgi:hypothetical protein